MKHLKNILSVALAAALVLMLASSAFAAPVFELDYDYALFNEDFEGVEEGLTKGDLDTAFPKLHIYWGSSKKDLTNKIAVDNGNNVLDFSRIESTTQTTNYVRFQRIGKNITEGTIQDIYGKNLEPLYQMKGSIDFRVNDALFKFSVQTLFFQHSDESLKASNFITIDEDGTIAVKNGAKSGEVISPDKWYTITFTMDCENDVCAVEVRERGTDGEPLVSTTAVLDSNTKYGIHGFAVSTNEKSKAYSLYLDNAKYEVPHNHADEYASDLAKLDFEEDFAVTDEIGISAAETQSFYTYEKFGKYPELIRAEASIKRTEVGETALYFGDTKIVGLAQDGLVSADSSIGLSTDSEWTKVTLDMDFASGTFDVFMDGEELAADATIPAGITSPEEFNIRVENGGTLYVDYMKVSTLAPYGSNCITGYINEEGALGYGYVVNNPSSEDRTYGILKVKYDKNGNYNGIEEITFKTIAPETMEIHTIKPDLGTDTNYYRYLMLDANTLEPLN